MSEDLAKKLPKELCDLLSKLGFEVENLKVVEKEIINFEKTSSLLGSLEGIKYILGGEIPAGIYDKWLQLSTHYACTSALFLKEVIRERPTEQALELLKDIHKNMKKLLRYSEENYREHQKCTEEECKHSKEKH